MLNTVLKLVAGKEIAHYAFFRKETIFMGSPSWDHGYSTYHK